MIAYVVVSKYLRYDPLTGRWDATFQGARPYERLTHAQVERREVLVAGDLDRDTRLASCEIQCVQLEPGAQFITRNGTISRVPSSDRAAAT